MTTILNVCIQPKWNRCFTSIISIIVIIIIIIIIIIIMF